MPAVPKYDAFGREIGENTLEGLGGGDRYQDRTTEPVPADGWTEAAPVAEPERPAVSIGDAPPAPQRPAPAAPSIPGQPRRRRGGVRVLGCLVSLVVLAAIAAGPVIGLVSFVDDARDTFDDVTGAFDDADIPTPGLPEVDLEEPAADPEGITGRSLLAPASLRRVFAVLERDGTKRVTRFIVRPARLETGEVRGRRERPVSFGFDGTVDRDVFRPRNDALGTLLIGDLDPASPARLVRNSAKQFSVRPQGIDYVIGGADTFSGTGHTWIAYFKNGVYVQGDERGRVLRRID